MARVPSVVLDLAEAGVRVSSVPLFADNYAWLIENAATRECVLVDAADAAPCQAAVAAADGRLAAILTTHWHKDHSGGNAELAAAAAAAPAAHPAVRLAVVAGAGEAGRVPAATRLVAHGEAVEAGGLRFLALATPCHTAGHVAFHLPAARAVFTGDTLFTGGCGRFFEGDAAAMAASLAVLAALPADTRILCGHEYTVANLEFCAAIEPGNAATTVRLAEARRLRAAGLSTVGATTLADELATNVFLRTGEAAVVAAVGGDGPVEVLARLRERKNAGAR